MTIGRDVNAKPGTMWGYIQELACLLKVSKFNFDLHIDPTFTDDATEYRQVMDYFFGKQKSDGAITNNDNTLVLSYIKRYYRTLYALRTTVVQLIEVPCRVTRRVPQ